jgi:HemK-like putative methylase
MAFTSETQVSVDNDDHAGGEPSRGRTSRAAPRTFHEDAVLTIYRDVLGRSDIDVSDDFFAYGTHSLAPTVVARIRKSLGVDIPVMDFFENRTVSALAAIVAARSSARPRAVAPRPPDSEPLLSFDQQRVWMENQLLPDGAYNNHARRRLVGGFDVATVEKCVRGIIRRHEGLRSRFPTVAGQPIAVVDEPDDSWRLRYEDVSAEPEADRLEAALGILHQEATTRLDVAEGPLFRCSMIKLSDTEHVLGITMHQIISDSRSIYVFEKELAALYQVDGDLDRADLPPLPVQYRDFAVWQRERLVGDRLDKQIDYWRQHLADAPPVLNLPTSKRRTKAQSWESGRVQCAMTKDETDVLHDICRANDVTPFMMLLAGLSTVFGRWSSQTDVVIGVALEGRADSEVDKLIGIFSNVLPFRNDLSGNPTFNELLSRVRRVALDGYANAEAPLDVLVGDMQVPRDPRRTPLFEVVLNVTAPPPIQQVPGRSVESMGTSAPVTRFDLFINAQTAGDGRLRFTFDFASDRFDHMMMQHLMENLRALLLGVIQDPARPILDYPLQPAGTEPVPATWSEPVPQLVINPQAVAADRASVVDPQGTWGYRRLAGAAGRIAALLAEGGIRPDDLSGLLREQNEPAPAAAAGGTGAPADWAVDRFHLTSEDRFAALTSEPAHLVSAMLSAFAAGGTLLLPGNVDTADVDALTRWLHSNQVTVLYADPPLIRALAAQATTPQFPALRCVFVDNTGEFIPQDIAALREMSATARCVGVYRVGPDGRPLAVYEVPDDVPLTKAPVRVSLGVDFPDRTLRLLNPAGQQATIGEVGEITAGSVRTGDIARRCPDGSLEYIRRADAGPVVDPLETVATLRDLPGVRDAIVTEHAKADGRTTYLGYIADPNRQFDSVAVHSFLRARLPVYLIPENTFVLDAIARTPGGGYDLQALPDLSGDVDAALDYVAPRTPMERELTDMLEELLDLDRVGVHDSFFELGGFSLLATKLTSRIKAAYNVELALRNVFDAPTVDELARLILRSQAEMSDTDELEALLNEIDIDEPGEAAEVLDPDTFPGHGSEPDRCEAIVARLRQAAVFGADKPDETPETSAQALWYAAAGDPRSTAGLTLPLPALSAAQHTTLDDLVARRIAGAPLAYLTGRGSFLGLEFLTQPGALIPRRETELLGRTALARVQQLATDRDCVRVLDLCTGAGNLAVSLAVLEPRARVWASDLEADAVAVATRNAAFHDVSDRVTFAQGDLFEALQRLSSPGAFDVVVCNPPYMPTGKVKSLPEEVGGHEPAAAFDGGDIGLSVLYRLIAEAPRHLVPGGTVCFELGAGMGRVVEKRLAEHGEYGDIRPIVDADGITRVITARRLA